MIRNDFITILCPPDPETERIAGILERELLRYRVPRDVAKRIGKRSLDQITDPWLIVVCTPETPSDPAINREIDRFIELGRFSNILTLLDSNRPDLSFPGQLITETREDGTVTAHEPLAANIHSESQKGKTRKLKVEKLRLLAPMFGVAFDDLMNRRRRARNRVLTGIGAAILTGGILFLGIALTKKTTLAAQNRELETLYEEADAARNEAETERAIAQEEYVKTVALTARRDAENGNTEAALISCLDFLPDMRNVTDLTDTFTDVLQKYCGEGFIPIGSSYDYRQTRELAFENSDAYHRTDDVYTRDEASSILVIPPEDLETGEKQITLSLCALSSSGEIRVYTYGNGGYFRICFQNEPERDYDLRDETGRLTTYDGLSRVTRNGIISRFYCCCFADDQTLLFLKDGELYRADIDSGLIQRLPEENGRPESTPDYRLLLSYPGTDVIFALRENRTEIWKREPLEYLTCIDGLEDIVVRGDADVFLGWQNGCLAVYGQNPFTCRYLIERDDGSGENALGTGVDTVILSDGRSALLFRSVLYDLNDGTIIADYRDESTQSPKISTEGYVLTTGYQTVSIWDPVTGRRLKTIRSCLSDRLNDTPVFQPYGPFNPDTGRRSISAVLIGSRVYEYRPFREMPAALEDRIALAKEILDTRDRLPAEILLKEP